MRLFGKCCSSCKYCRVRMKTNGSVTTSVAWCKKHRDIFDLHSLCESYDAKEISEVTNETDN